MHKKLPAPATVLASIALLVSLTGTAVAAGAVPLAKKAMFASNSGKLQGRTAGQVAAIPGPANSLNGRTAGEIAATPGPATDLNGLTAAQIAALPGPATDLGGKTLADVVATPGPASTAAGLVSTATSPFTLAADDAADFSASCAAGSKVVSGGYAYNGKAAVFSVDTRPTSDTTWSIYLVNESTDTGASGTIYAVCVK